MRPDNSDRVLLWAVFFAFGCDSAFLAPAFGGEPAQSSPRVRLELNGTWQFRTDPGDEGLRGRWYAAEVAFADSIRVPGNWQAQGVGPGGPWLRHDYQGKAWYRRTVRVPAEWSGRRVWLHLGGTVNTADVFVNARPVGRVEGFVTPYELDVTKAVRPGADNTIACRVDSTGPCPVGLFNFVARWGGLVREVFLEARPEVAIDDLFVIPDVKNKTARVQVTIRRTGVLGGTGCLSASAGALGGTGCLSASAEALGGKQPVPPGVADKQPVPPNGQHAIVVRIRPVAGGGSVAEGRGTIRLEPGRQESDPVTIPVPLADLHPWSPEDPFLYHVEVSLVGDGKPVDLVCDRFGMRQFEVGPGGVLLLNGRPYFVRGIGDDTVEVLTGTQAPDKKVYLERLRLIKRYGFNGVRFLGNTPIDEYFQAADEVGVLVMAEGQIYRKPKESIGLLKEQVARIARAYRNHPSWFVWSAGNELFECQGASPDREWMDYIVYAHDTFKRLDPTRLFVASDGADVFPTDVITQAAKFSGPGPAMEQPFDGLIDEVAYFKRALGEDEIGKAARPAPGYAATIRSLNPSGYWRFGETAAGRAIDHSGQARHGTYDPTMTAAELNLPGTLAPHEPGGAIRTDAKHKGVHLAESARTVFAVGSGPFGISLWVKPEGFRPGDFGTPFAYGSTIPGAGLLVALDGVAGTGKLRLGRYCDDFLVSAASLEAGRWNHVGITYDGSELKLYLDGKLDSSRKVKLAVVPADGRIGGSITAPSKADPGEQDRYQSRPHLWHEFPNSYVGPIPDLALAEKYTGVYRDPSALGRHRQQIAALGLADRYAEVRRNSLGLFHLYLKDIFEQARHSPTMDGYFYWCMTDYPAGPEGDMTTYGLLNPLYEPEKFPEAGPILRFNRETVLLIDAGPDRRVVAADEARPVTLSLSHYGDRPIQGGRVEWHVAWDRQAVQQGVLEPIQVSPGQVKPLGKITLGPVCPRRGVKLRLVARLESPACQQENAWEFWVFPATRPGLRDKPIANLTGLKPIDDRYGLDPRRPLTQAGVILAERLTPQVIEQLAAGKTVVLLAGPNSLARGRTQTFWPPWIRSTATAIEPTLAASVFPHDGFCAYQFYRLFGDGAAALNLTEKGSIEREKLIPLVWALTQDYDPAQKTDWSQPTNRWKFFRHGLVCEGRYGKGRLVICGFRILTGLEARHPEAGCLLDCLVAYALSDSPPPATAPMTPDELRQVFR